MKKATILVLGILLAPVAGAQVQAPFCHVSNTGFASCFYWSLDACRQATASLGGMCSANAQSPPRAQQRQYAQPTQIQMPDIAGSFQRGQAFGAEQRRLKEEHEAKMRLIEAQTQAIQSQQQQRFWQQPQQPAAEAQETPTQGEYYRAIYKCGDSPTYTPIPAPGCVVISVYP